MLEAVKYVENDLEMVEEELKNLVMGENATLSEIGINLINAGGKRLRPALCLLCGKFGNYSVKKVLPLAVAIELAHMATLVHDDVVDASTVRRGRQTVVAQWGDKISIHVGNYLFARAQMLTSRYDNPEISAVFADTSMKMCRGEIQQLSSSYDAEITLKEYLSRIKSKTALLITASCKLGALVCDAPKDFINTFSRYGNYLGTAFQITDDILDIVAKEYKLGKPVGGDLREGIVTLPVIYALKNSPQKRRLKKLIKNRNKSQENILEAIDIVKGCRAVEYSMAVAERYIDKAKEQIASLPDIPSKEALLKIADFIKKRDF